MINFTLDPFKLLLTSVEELYGNVNADIQFAHFGEEDEGVGNTLFPDDGSTPLITISADIPYAATIEIAAHELAHVIAGPEAEHNEAWGDVFSQIHKKFQDNMEKAATEEAKG